MFTYVDQIGWGAVAFVVSWVILGKYIFLTLFLAVIMEAFESKYDIQATKELKFLGRRRNKRQKRAAKAAEAARQRELSAGNAAPKEPSAPSGRTSPPIKDAPAPGRALSQPRQVSGGESSEKTGGTGQKRRTQSLGRSGQVAPAPMSQRGGASAASDGPQRIMTKSADRENPTGEHAHDRNKASSMGRSKGDETGASSRERRDIGRGGEPDGSQHTLGPPRRRIKGASVTFAEEHQEAPTRSGRSVTFGEQAGMRPRAMPMIAEMRPAIKTSRGASASSGRGEQSDREAGRGGGGRARGGAARQKPAAPVGFGSSARKPVAEAVERRTLYGGASGPVAESTESAERRTVPRGRDHSAEGAGREESDCDMDRRAFPRRGPVGEGVEGTSGPRSSLEPMTRVVKQSGERVSRVGFRVADQKESSTGSGVEKELSRRNSEFSMISGDADSVSVVSDLQDLMDLQEEVRPELAPKGCCGTVTKR